MAEIHDRRDSSRRIREAERGIAIHCSREDVGCSFHRFRQLFSIIRQSLNA